MDTSLNKYLSIFIKSINIDTFIFLFIMEGVLREIYFNFLGIIFIYL